MKTIGLFLAMISAAAVTVVLGSALAPKTMAALSPESTVDASLRPVAPSQADAVSGTIGSEPVVAYQEFLPINTEAAEQAWRDWMGRHNIKASAMALGINGKIVSTAERVRKSDAPFPVASLSKAITAMCLNDILAETGYNWSTTLNELGPTLETINMAPHDDVRALTLGDLATHTSGFPKNIDGDETAGEGRNLYTQQHFAREALTTPGHQNANRRYSYSNVNYAVLGQIISALTEQPYGDVCAARVTAPAGATDAVVGGRMWATAGFGGWSASAESYARFVMHWLAPDRPWVTEPANFAFDEASGSGLGMFFTQGDGGYVISHNGLWRSKKLERQHGAIFVITETGATFVANWQGEITPNLYTELRNAVAPHLR